MLGRGCTIGILIDEAERLLRKTWNSPQELAQELYSILTTKEPIKVDSPVQVATNNPEAALTITNNFGDGSGLALNVNGGTVTNGDTVFGGSAFTYTPGGFNVGGNVQQVYFPANGPQQDFSTLLKQIFEGLGLDRVRPFVLAAGPASAPGDRAPGGGTGPSPGTGPLAGEGGGGTEVAAASQGLVGIVKSGTGGKYQVTIYPLGFDRDHGADVEVEVPNILASETIDAGTKIVGIVAITRPSSIIGQTSIIYYYQPPVWGE